MLQLLWSAFRVRVMTSCLSNKDFCRLPYQAITGKLLRLDPPIDFNEELE